MIARVVYVTVRGGTNAGWRRTRPARKPWRCRCLVHEGTAGPQIGEHESIDRLFRLQPGYLPKCMGCGMERP